MSLKLFEIIRWGNPQEGPDGEDTCYLVRARTVEEAAHLVDIQLFSAAGENVRNYAQAAYLVGADASGLTTDAIVRGPYVQFAYCCGWRTWLLEEGKGWIEGKTRRKK